MPLAFLLPGSEYWEGLWSVLLTQLRMSRRVVWFSTTFYQKETNPCLNKTATYPQEWSTGMVHLENGDRWSRETPTLFAEDASQPQEPPRMAWLSGNSSKSTSRQSKAGLTGRTGMSDVARCTIKMFDIMYVLLSGTVCFFV